MNRILFVIASVLITSPLLGQSEFETHKNGLIYSEKTMAKLEHIVDSLNLKYKVCDFSKVFNSKSQAIGHIIQLDTNNVTQAKKDIENNISFEDFVLKYPNAKVERNVLIVKYKEKNSPKKEIIEFTEISPAIGNGLSVTQENTNNLYNKALKKSWIFNYGEKSEYSKEAIIAFYFPEGFKTILLDLKYSRQIGYSDCLIDTSTTKFKDKLKEGSADLPTNWQSLSKKKQVKLLDEMRSTQVFGRCSQDGSPRQHAANIALLSAETTNWGVFLKSHLDIMNDRFDRMSDGSYAYAGRGTYIKELEELDINVIDLLIGISLRVENPAKNHYFGNINRLGRAISESKEKEQFRKQILSMVEDNGLDNFNRVLAYFLFLNFNGHLENKDEQNANIKLLEDSIKTMPTYLKEKINLKKK